MNQTTAHWKILTAISVTIGFVGLIIVIVLFTATGGYVPFDYGIVVDAGSSHSQITLYHWKADKMRLTGVVEQIDTCYIEPGISSYNMSQPEKIGIDVLDCVNKVSRKVDESRLIRSPLYLGATAGMRVLNIKSSMDTELIFRRIGHVLQHNTGFSVKTIDIISGQNEGLFSWVTNNYLADKLIVESFDESKPNTTIGMLDMGGASAQIAYRTGNEEVKSENELQVTLYGIKHTVHSSSNLCFGANEAYLRYQKFLIMNKYSEDRPIDDPCLPIGTELIVRGEELKDQICLAIKDTTKEIDFNRDYRFNGIGNGDQCLEVVSKQLINKTECEKTFDICFNVSVSSPPESMLFYGISNFYHNPRVLNLSQPVKEEEYLRKTKELCAQTPDQMKTSWPHVFPKFVNRYCFNLNFIYTTITTIYKFTPNMWPNLEFKQDIRNNDLGWSMGLMINATNAIPTEKPSPPVVPIVPFFLIFILCLIFLFFSIYFAMIWIKIERKTNDQNESYEQKTIN